MLMPQVDETGTDGVNSVGMVTLNAEGRQYTASYRLAGGVITVTFGAASTVIRVGEAVIGPRSVARTILRKMVANNRQSAKSG